MSKEENAKALFAKGYNCAQSVIGVFCADAGLDTSTAFRLANGFGGGVRCGELCGAASGAVLVVGLRCGFHEEGDLARKNYCNQKTYEFLEQFKAVNGSVLCRDLLGADIRRPEDHMTETVKAAHKTVCPGAIASAVRILEGMAFEG